MPTQRRIAPIVVVVLRKYLPQTVIIDDGFANNILTSATISAGDGSLANKILSYWIHHRGWIVLLLHSPNHRFSLHPSAYSLNNISICYIIHQSNWSILASTTSNQPTTNHFRLLDQQQMRLCYFRKIILMDCCCPPNIMHTHTHMH